MFTESVGSKVGRRLFLLFGTCALLPLLALAAWVYFAGRTYLIDTEHKEMRADSKAYAMSLLDRIQLLESRLLDTARLRDASELSPNLVPILAEHFDAVGVLGPDGEYTSLLGATEPLTAQGPKRRSTRTTGTTEIFSLSSPSLGIELGESGDELLVGRPRPAYLWWGSTEENTLPANTNMLVLVDGGVLLSTADLPATAIESLVEEIERARSGRLVWEVENQSFLAGFWTLPLAIRFTSSDWTIMWYREQADVLRPIAAFQRSSLLVFIGAFLGMTLLTLSQIRRTLKPLKILKEGTQRLASQDFEARVVIATDDEFRDVALSFNAMAERLGDLIADLDRLQLGTLHSLARAIDEQSPWTLGHSERVARLAVRTASRLGLTHEVCQTMYRAALLHDIGKLGIPAELLNKPTKLEHHERAIMEGHVEAGVRILEPFPGYEDVGPIVAQHHERLDGSGYPRGLREPDIGLGARILAIVDSYDALSSTRPYRARLSPDDVLAELERCSGTLFDPRVLEAFLGVVRTAGEAGSSPAPSAAGQRGLA